MTAVIHAHAIVATRCAPKTPRVSHYNKQIDRCRCRRRASSLRRTFPFLIERARPLYAPRGPLPGLRRLLFRFHTTTRIDRPRSGQHLCCGHRKPARMPRHCSSTRWHGTCYINSVSAHTTSTPSAEAVATIVVIATASAVGDASPNGGRSRSEIIGGNVRWLFNTARSGRCVSVTA